jgi:hypothetical protein
MMPNEMQIEMDYDKEIILVMIWMNDKDSTKNYKKGEISKMSSDMSKNKHYKAVRTQN